MRRTVIALVCAAALLTACGRDDVARPGGSTVPPATSVVPATSAPPTTGPGVDLATLTRAWGCGYGAAASNPDQTLGLQLSAMRPPVTGAPIVLPDPNWKGELRFGTNLFANWCNDVIMAGAPHAQVDETWDVQGGTITIDAPAGVDGCGGGSTSVHVRGLVVERPNGALVDLGDIDLTNDAWGCFAG